MDPSKAFLDVGRSVLDRGHRIRFRASGRSMGSTIADGETVVIEPVEAGEVRVGDIVLGEIPAGPVVHRVVGRSPGPPGEPAFVLRGDASFTADPPIEGSRILGRAVAVERGGREVPLGGTAGPASGPGAPPPGREAEVLMACLRPRLSPGDPALRDLLAGGIDWEVLGGLARRHGLGPLLARLVEAAGPDGIPPAVLASGRDLLAASRRRNLFLAGELARILDRLGAAGVRAAAMKGIALAAAAYPDIALRPFADLDILVLPDDRLPAGDALRAIGYRPLREPAGRKGGGETETVYSRLEGRLFVEVHTATAPRHLAIRQDTAGLLARRTDPGPLGFPTLSPEDTVLALVIHGGVHLWERLIWTADLARLVEVREGPDWDRVIRDAEAIGAARMLRIGLLLAEMAGAALPPGPAAWAAADRPAGALSAALLRRALVEPRPPGPLEIIRVHMAMRERRRDRLRYCLRVALKASPGDGPVIGGLPLPLRAPFRLLRLSIRHGPAAARRLLGSPRAR